MRSSARSLRRPSISPATATSRRNGSCEATRRRTVPRPVPRLGNDGNWSTVSTGTESFSTRLLVRRPADSARVRRHRRARVVERERRDRPRPRLGAVLRGDAARRERLDRCVGAARRQRSTAHARVLAAARALDPERYGTLHIPNDDLSYGIFTAAARLVRAGELTAGAPVDLVIASGASQSANRLVTYVNGVHPLEGAIDAFLVHGRVRHHVSATRRPTWPHRSARAPDTRSRGARSRARVRVRHPAIVGRDGNPTRSASGCGARRVDAPGRVRRAHTDGTVRGRPRTRDGRLRLRGERHALPLRGERGTGTPARLGVPRRARSAAPAHLLECSGRGRPRPPRQRPGRYPAPPPRRADRRGTGPSAHPPCAHSGASSSHSRQGLPRLYTVRDDYLATLDAAPATPSGPDTSSNRMPSRRAPSQPRRTNKRSVEESAAVHAPHLTVHPRAVVREQVRRDRRDVVGTARPCSRGSFR